MTNWGLAGGQRLGWGVIDDGWRKGPWTAEEDRLLIDYVKLHGDGRWSSVASVAGLRRNGKSCRLRWVNYLRPDLKRGQITPHEESIILEQHAKWGNRWSKIARSLPGRTDNEIKNYWRTHFKRQTKGTANNNSEKKRTRLLKKKNFQKQQLLQQQQQWKQKQQEHELQEKEQYCDQLDVEILSLPDQSDNKVLTVPQLRQEISNTMYPNPHPIEEQGISYPTFDNELLLPEDMNEDGVPWDELWSLEDTHATFMQPVQQTN